MLFKSKVIAGCESDGTADSPYLTRTTIFESRFGNLYIHKFHRSDRDDLHDHPWNFWTLILWRGYVEVLQSGRRRRLWPGMILYRRATHTHRVELINGKPAVTLIFRGPYVRQWGFLCPDWVHWQKYFKDKGC